MSNHVPRQRFADKFFIKEMLPQDLLEVMGQPGHERRKLLGAVCSGKSQKGRLSLALRELSVS